MTSERNAGSGAPAAGQDAIWDYYQTQAPETFGAAEPRLRHLAGMLRAGQKVLNIGVGSGRFEELVSGAGVAIHSLDPSARTIEDLQRRFRMESTAKVGYSNQIPFDGGLFDVVVASEVLEHLPDEALKASIQEIRRVLVPGGAFIGTVPSRDPIDLHRVVCPNCAFQFHRWGHVRSFTEDSLRRSLAEAFPAISIRERAFISWKHLNWKGCISGALKLTLSRLGLHGSNENFVFVARKP